MACLLAQREQRRVSRCEHDCQSVRCKAALESDPRLTVELKLPSEALLLSLVCGLTGLGAASLMQTLNISTTNFQTFAELAFQFKLTPTIARQTPAFALFMGVFGGFIQAWLAARVKIVDCLRVA